MRMYVLSESIVKEVQSMEEIGESAKRHSVVLYPNVVSTSVVMRLYYVFFLSRCLSRMALRDAVHLRNGCILSLPSLPFLLEHVCAPAAVLPVQWWAEIHTLVNA